ncbi:MAG TPA: hypothetical protein VL490_08025 [Mucilaginibacter sp.]|jgi:hypothetical protein|nr:hypothetical protein [Mucilaginibacter sp.]
MKRNLLIAIILTSAAAWSSCSTPAKLAGTKVMDDDVYFTKAKSGDQMIYASDNQNNYTGDNDYYYYGDYASRISRFSYASPFDYDDDFYFSYSGYSPYSSLSPVPNTTANGNDYQAPPYYINSTSAYNIGGIYSPYDYGYSDYYMGGYDDFGYGNIYSSFIIGGGGSRRSGSRGHNYARMINRANGSSGNAAGAPLTFHKGRTGVVNSGSTAAYYPGNPNRNSTNGRNTAVAGYNNVRPIRSVNDNPRQVVQSVDRAPAQQSTSNSSSGSSGGSASSAGGGGRPVRP